MGNAVPEGLNCGAGGAPVCDCRDHKKPCSAMTVAKAIGSDTCLDPTADFDGAIDSPAVKESMINYDLLKAARDGRTENVSAHLRNGAFLETRRPFAITFELESIDGHESLGLTPLMYAALGGYTSTCEVLLAAQADVNAQDEDGMQPLHFAASSGNMEACKMLLRFHADPGSLDCEGRTALEHVPPIDCCTRSERQAWEAILGPTAPRLAKPPEKVPPGRQPAQPCPRPEGGHSEPPGPGAAVAAAALELEGGAEQQGQGL